MKTEYINELIQQSAREAYLSGVSLEDWLDKCPIYFLPHQEEMARQYWLTLFEHTCEDDPCSI
jgi:hypothetical protein